MRVIHIDTGMEWRGGQSQVLMLAKGLINYNCNTIIIAKKESQIRKRASAAGIPCETLPFRFEADIASARMLSGMIGSEADVVLHTHTPHALGLALLARGFSPMPPLVFTRRVAFPIKKNPVSRWKLNQADRLVAVSNAVAMELKDAGIPAEKIRIIHSGVDLDLVAFHGPCLEKPFSIAIAGSIEKEKGLMEAMEFIDLCISLPTVFHFLGSGPGMEELNHFASFRANVVVHGFLEDIVSALKNMYGLISFSPSEGFGNMVLQAMAAGLPVLARKNGGTLEMIQDERYGYLFDTLPDAVSMFQTMLQETEKSIQTGRRASERVRSQFSGEEMVRKNYELYKEILA
jgi:L-malate glycosyltransferase